MTRYELTFATDGVRVRGPIVSVVKEYELT
jgi:hypothetical protein